MLFYQVLSMTTPNIGNKVLTYCGLVKYGNIDSDNGLSWTNVDFSYRAFTWE